MSNQEQQQPLSQSQSVVVQQAPSNGMGLAGFITSLVSLVFTCGMLSPVAFILSLIGLFKKPKGLALAGAILSGLQILAILIVGVAPILAVIGIGLSLEKEQKELYQKDRVEILETLRTSNDAQEIRQIKADFNLLKDKEFERALEEAIERVPEANLFQNLDEPLKDVEESQGVIQSYPSIACLT